MTLEEIEEREIERANARSIAMRLDYRVIRTADMVLVEYYHPKPIDFLGLESRTIFELVDDSNRLQA